MQYHHAPSAEFFRPARSSIPRRGQPLDRAGGTGGDGLNYRPRRRPGESDGFRKRAGLQDIHRRRIAPDRLVTATNGTPLSASVQPQLNRSGRDRGAQAPSSHVVFVVASVPEPSTPAALVIARFPSPPQTVKG